VKIASLVKYRQRLNDEKASYFADWPAKPEQREACWQNLAQTVDALIALGQRGTVEDATDILRRCVAVQRVGCTIEREELCGIAPESRLRIHSCSVTIAPGCPTAIILISTRKSFDPHFGQLSMARLFNRHPVQVDQHVLV